MRRYLSEFILFMVVSLSLVYLFYRYQAPLAYFIKSFLPDKLDPRSRNLTSFGIHIPEQYSVHGLDISHYQGAIDWPDVKRMNLEGISFQFVYMKATEGKEQKDAFFDVNWKKAKEYGLLRGAYHFYRPEVKSTVQAQHFIQTVALDSGDLPPVLDIEVQSPYGDDNLRRGLTNWLRLVEAHYGIRPLIYTNLNFYEKHLEGHFHQYQFWIAQYGRYDTKMNRARWWFWQYSNQGKVNGIAGEVDFNAFQGDLVRLKAICLP